MRSFFGSQGGSSRSSRRERLEQAKQHAAAEKTRRRNFGFLKTGDKRMSTTTLNKRREHAKQLAMVYNDPVETPSPTPTFEPPPDLFDFKVDETFDPFNTAATSATSTTAPSTISSASSKNSVHNFNTPQDRELTASTQESFETASVGSGFDMDFTSPSRLSHQSTPKKSRRKAKTPSLDQFVGRNSQTPPAKVGGSLVVDSKKHQGTERSVISMPTIPSNSSMQASFARQPAPRSHSSGAASRRRKRSQLRHQSSASSVSSVDDISSYNSTPPESPAGSFKYDERNHIAPASVPAMSFRSQGSSGNNSQQSSTDLFDADNDGGFTFDAFGLDQSQIEREVNAAMDDLVGQGMPGFSLFLSGDHQEEDFEPQNWDSPAGSRNSSPPRADDDDGFVDGFRVTKTPQPKSGRSLSPVPSGSRSTSRTPKPRTPPRWEHHQTPASQQTQPEEDLFSGGSTNPWNDDPWGSDPEEFQSEIGTPSDFGTTQSEIAQPSFQQFSHPSGAKSDFDTAFTLSAEKSVDFGDSAHTEQHFDTDGVAHDDDDMSHMQEAFAQQFAEQFVQKISPRNGTQQEVSRVLDYGESHDEKELVPSNEQMREYWQQQYEHSDVRGTEFDGDSHAFEANFGQEQVDFAQNQTGFVENEPVGFAPEQANFGQEHVDFAQEQSPFSERKSVGFDEKEQMDFGQDPDGFGQQDGQIGFGQDTGGFGDEEVHFGKEQIDYGQAEKQFDSSGSSTQGGQWDPPYSGQDHSQSNDTYSDHERYESDYNPGTARRHSQMEDSDYGQSDFEGPGSDHGPAHADYYGPRTPVSAQVQPDPSPVASASPAAPSYRARVAQEAVADLSSKSRFSNFRSRYESSRESAPATNGASPAVPGNDKPALANVTVRPRRGASYRSPKHQTEEEEEFESDYLESDNFEDSESHGPMHGDYGPPRPQTGVYRPTYEYGNLRSSYAAAKFKVAPNASAAQGSGYQSGSSFTTNPESDRPLDSDAYDEDGDETVVQEQMPRRQSHGSRSVRSEEKKDDESPTEPKKTGSLKDKWRQWETKPNQQTSNSPRPPSSHSSAAARWTNPNTADPPEIEMITPELIEERRNEKRRTRAEEVKSSPANTVLSPHLLKPTPAKTVPASQKRQDECLDQRTSFASLRERLKPSNVRVDTRAKYESGGGYRGAQSEAGGGYRSAQSEVGGGYKSPMAAMASDVVDRIRRNSPSNAASDNNSQGGSYRETQSDVGSSPSFLTNLKLRKTRSPRDMPGGNTTPKAEPGSGNKPMSYRERRALEQQTSQEQESEVEQSDSQADPVEEPKEAPPQPPVEKKLTYRERRELELKKEREEKAKLEANKEKEAPKKDVAALIRKRIAANKQKTATGAAAGQPATTTPQFGGLKKSSSKDESSRPSPSPRGPFSNEERASERLSSSQHSSGVVHQNSAIEGVQTLRSPVNQGSGMQNSPRHGFDLNVHTTPRYGAGVVAQDARQSGEMHQPNSFRTSASPQHQQQGGDSQQQEQGNPFDSLSPSSAATDMEYSTATDTSPKPNGGNFPPSKFTSDVGFSQESPRNAVAQESPKSASSRRSGSSRLKKFVAQQNEADGSDDEGGPPAQAEPVEVTKPADKDVKSMLSNFLGGRMSLALPIKKKAPASAGNEPAGLAGLFGSKPTGAASSAGASGGRPALKDDPKYERYFRMLKVGMPLEVVKHAMQKDGVDPSVMDGDHNKPVGVPLKEDPKYTKYFKMLKIGISMEQVKHSMERDGLSPDVMDGDHDLPAGSGGKKKAAEPKKKDTHRRARLHWKTLQKICRNSLWAKIEKDETVQNVEIDEEEFKNLFQAELSPDLNTQKGLGANRKKGAAVRVIDAKRANNGGIILARVKMTHDEMADAVDRIDGDALTAGQIENIIEFLPSREERQDLEKYMLDGGQDAAEKFDGLCECEKFMVSMMTVKHAKRKVRALLFKLQFHSCLESIAEDAQIVENACDELSNSNRLRQLLGIVLQFGNRLNTAGATSNRKAGAFTLDSLLKLSQAKAFDKKTTFLHYVILIVQRNNELLLNFADDLPTVLKGEKVYWDQCLSDLEEVENQLENVRRIALYEANNRKKHRFQKRKSKGKGDDEDDGNDSLGELELTLEEEVTALRATPIGVFTLSAIKQVSAIRDKVEVTREKYLKVLEYFGEDERNIQPHELFNIFSTFARDFGKARDDVFSQAKARQREDRKKARKQANNNRGKPPAGPDRTARPLKASSHQPNLGKVVKDFMGGGTDKKKPTSPSKSSRRQRKVNAMMESRNQAYKVQTQSNATQGAEPARSPRAGLSNHHHHQQQQQQPSQSKMPEAPLPQGMQESGHYENVAVNPQHQMLSPSSISASREAKAKEALRQKARSRRQRHMKIMNDRSTPVASNTSLRKTAYESRTTPASSSTQAPTPPVNANQGVPPRNTATATTPRQHMMRHRRRLEARK